MANTTTDHDTIRRWIEDRGGVPATVEGTSANDDQTGILRVDFPDPVGRDHNLTTISWEAFFEKFEEAKLAFLHDDKTSGGELSRFNKFISR